jgi:hypothetical protein
VVQQPGQHLEEQVCDRFEAVWAASLAAELLPPRQAEALHLTAAGYDVQQVASELGVNYRAAESLLARARRTLRAALTAGVGAVAWSWRGPWTAASNSASLALASAVVAAGVAVATAPVLLPEEPPGTFWGPALPESHQPPISSIPRNHPAPETTAPETTAAPGGVHNSIPESLPAPPHVVLPSPRLALGELANSPPAAPPLSPSVVPPVPLSLPPVEDPAPLSAAPSPPPAASLPRAVLPPPLRTPAPLPPV